MGQSCQSHQPNPQFEEKFNPQKLNLAKSQRRQTNSQFDSLSQKIKQRIQQLKYKPEQLAQVQKHKIIELSKKIFYQGNMQNNQMIGYGRLMMPDGSYYQGEFKCNKLQGEGLLIDQNGGYYMGIFKDSKAEGKGLYVKEDYVYQGQFKNNLQSGFGKEAKADQIYEGIFNKGKKKKGKLTNKKQQTIYEGQFQGNIENGYGLLYKNDQIHEGVFKNGFIQGQGKIIYADGREKIVFFQKGNIQPDNRLAQIKGELAVVKEQLNNVA